jgi:GNAT superfamily N-acetyltransferase
MPGQFELRLARPEDRERMLAISAQIWEGDDYVPAVVDGWLADPQSGLIVALLGGVLVAFAHLRWLLPGYAWLEGLRSDPEYRNQGAGRALTDYLIHWAAQAGAERIGLSTYIDNYASIHIIEAHGFRRVAGYVFLEAGPESPARAAGRRGEAVESVPVDEAAAFVAASQFLAAAQGHFPHGWTFYPFARGPEQVLAGMQHVLGVRRAGRLSALLCSSRPARGTATFGVDFLDGNAEDCEILLRHALHLASQSRMVEASVPKWGDQAAPALPLFRRLGFHAWYDYNEDMFVYER